MLISSREPKHDYYHFILCFFLINAFISLLLLFIYYFKELPRFQILAETSLSGVFVWFYFAASFIAQIAILFLLCIFVMSLINTLFANRIIIYSLSIVLGAFILFGLALDTLAYNLYHMHYAFLAWEIVKAHAFTQVITLSKLEKFILAIVIVILIGVESLIALLTLSFIKKHHVRYCNYLFSFILISCIITSYGLNYFAKQSYSHPVLSTNTRYLMVKAARFIPYYNEVYQVVAPTHNVVSGLEMFAGRTHKNNQLLDYPKHELQCHQVSKPFNILIISIDAWRFDAMNENITPNIYRFAKKAIQFQNHWSGGNCTKAGLYSMFYGIPSNYWDASLKQNRGPELIHQLIKANYTLRILASAQLNFPAFDQTIFREITPVRLKTPLGSSVERDKIITKEFVNFINAKDIKQPFFSLLFYDAVHNYCEENAIHQHPFKPWIKTCDRFKLTSDTDPQPYVNRYRNAVYFVDSQIKQVIAALEDKQLLQNTIVILTADHGEEINDNHSGLWQHASGYSSYQLHVPFIVYWPGQKPRSYHHLTTHYDLAPSLLTLVLNCTNPYLDYSIGKPLFSFSKRPVLIAGSYADYANVSKNQILRIYPGGDMSFEDQNGKPINEQFAKFYSLQQTASYLNYYFK